MKLEHHHLAMPNQMLHDNPLMDVESNRGISSSDDYKVEKISLQ